MDKSESIRKQTIVLAKLNAILDIICYATDQKVKLDKELKKLEEENKKDE